MFGLIKFIKARKEKKKIKNDEKKLINEIHATVVQIAQTELWFRMESDKNLIDSCIYQRELLHSKYKHLISKAKVDNIKICPKYIIESIRGN